VDTVRPRLPQKAKAAGELPVRQGQGRGAAAMLWRLEGTCGRGGRLLLVETSALPRYDRTRAFYARCGYEEEARIRDYLAAGDNLVAFRTALHAD
jgi:GNAT superfamily N-acetyltransferase